MRASLPQDSDIYVYLDSIVLLPECDIIVQYSL